MNIAFTMAPGRGDTDLLLFQLAEEMMRQGFKTTGTAQINTEREQSGPCDMDVRVLPEGPTIRISQDLGGASRGCRLDPTALEEAVALVETRLEAGADCLIVNKFGKHEAEGRGFRTAIALALSKEIPVLVGLNPLNAPAFEDFTAGLATELEPQPATLLNWMHQALAARTAA